MSGEGRSTNTIGLLLQFTPGVALPAILSVVGAAVFTRLLDPTAYGRYSLSMSLVGLATALLYQWLYQGTLRYVPDQGADTGFRPVPVILILGISLSLGIALLGGPAVSILKRFVPAQWDPLLVPSVLIVALLGISNLLFAVIQGRLNASAHSILRIALAVFRLLFAILFVVGFRLSEAGLLWGLAVAILVVLPFQFQTVLTTRREIFQESFTSLSSGLIRLARYGAPLTGWFLASHLLNAGDRYVLQLFRGSSAVGLYSVNYDLAAQTAALLVAPILLTLHPVMISSMTRANHHENERLIGRAVNWFAVAGMALFGLVLVFSADVVGVVLGKEFSSGIKVVPFVFLGTLFWQLGFYLNKPVEVAEKTRVLLIFSMSAAALNLIMNILTIPRWGILAAAVTTVASFGAYSAMLLWYLKRQLGFNLPLAQALAMATGILVTFGLIRIGRVVVGEIFGNLAGLGFAVALSTATIAGVVVGMRHFRGRFWETAGYEKQELSEEPF